MFKFTSSTAFRFGIFAVLALLLIPALLALGHVDPSHLGLLGMAAATAGIDAQERAGQIFGYPVGTGVHIYPGTMVALNATGFAVPAANTLGLRVVGRAEDDIDNSAGADGDQAIRVKRSVFKYANSVTNVITAAMVGKPAFVEDDNTVGSTGTNKVRAGRILGVDSDGIWIDTAVGNEIPAADTITGAADLAALKTALLALLQGAGIVK